MKLSQTKLPAKDILLDAKILIQTIFSNDGKVSQKLLITLDHNGENIPIHDMLLRPHVRESIEAIKNIEIPLYRTYKHKE